MSNLRLNGIFCDLNWRFSFNNVFYLFPMSSVFLYEISPKTYGKNSQQKRMCVTKQNKWLQWRKKDPDWLCLVFLSFSPFFMLNVLWSIYVLFLCIYVDGKLIDEFSIGKFFRNSNNNGFNNISYHYQIICIFFVYSRIFHLTSMLKWWAFIKEISNGITSAHNKIFPISHQGMKINILRNDF